MTQHRFNPAARPCAALLAVSMSIALPVYAKAMTPRLARSVCSWRGPGGTCQWRARGTEARGADPGGRPGRDLGQWPCACALCRSRRWAACGPKACWRSRPPLRRAAAPGQRGWPACRAAPAGRFPARPPRRTTVRLNAPIAAIGVRSDFIVQADPSGAPRHLAAGDRRGRLGGACLATALGPCAGGDVRVLSASMGRLMAEVRPGDHVTRIVPAAGALLTNAAYGAETGRSQNGGQIRCAVGRAAGSGADAFGLAAGQRPHGRRIADHCGRQCAGPESGLRPIRAIDLGTVVGFAVGRRQVERAILDCVHRAVTSRWRTTGAGCSRRWSNPQHLLSDALNAKVDFGWAAAVPV